MDARSRRRRTLIVAVFGASWLTAAPTTRGVQSEPIPSASELFRVYRQRAFDEVERALDRVRDWAQYRLEIDRAIATGPFEAGAAFSLEAAIRAIVKAGRNTSKPEFPIGSQLLRVQLKRLRDRDVPTEFERRWLMTAMALVQGLGTDAPVRAAFADLFEHAARRFPNDPEVQFAVLLEAEQELIVWDLVRGVEVAQADSQDETDALRVARRKMEETAAGYRKLASAPTVGTEALVRTARMRLMRREFDLALNELSGVSDRSSDPAIRYLARLFEGHALAGLGRWRDAIEAYERALALRPGTQSAQLSLAAVLYMENRPNDAADRVRSVLAAGKDDADPWAWYHYGGFRHLTGRVDAMRAALK